MTLSLKQLIRSGFTTRQAKVLQGLGGLPPLVYFYIHSGTGVLFDTNALAAAVEKFGSVQIFSPERTLTAGERFNFGIGDLSSGLATLPYDLDIAVVKVRDAAGATTDQAEGWFGTAEGPLTTDFTDLPLTGEDMSAIVQDLAWEPSGAVLKPTAAGTYIINVALRAQS